MEDLTDFVSAGAGRAIYSTNFPIDLFFGIARNWPTRTIHPWGRDPAQAVKGRAQLFFGGDFFEKLLSLTKKSVLCQKSCSLFQKYFFFMEFYASDPQKNMKNREKLIVFHGF